MGAKHYRSAPPRRDSVHEADWQPYVAAQRLQQAQAAFDDRAAQLAAYWDGVDVVRELQRAHGADWQAELPLSTQKFIARVEGRLDD